MANDTGNYPQTCMYDGAECCAVLLIQHLLNIYNKKFIASGSTRNALW